MSAFRSKPPLMPAILPAAIPAPRKVVIVYDDLAADHRAARELARLKAESPPGTELTPLPWSFAYLVESPFRLRALDEVDGAALLIISISQLDDVPAVVSHWLRACLSHKRFRSVPVIALFDEGLSWSLSLADAIAARDPQLSSLAESPDQKIHSFPLSVQPSTFAQACA